MNNRYKVRSCCSTSGCDYVYHRDIVQTINHESSFSFCMAMNGLNELDVKMKCPQCGQRMFFYPVSLTAEPLHYE